MINKLKKIQSEIQKEEATLRTIRAKKRELVSDIKKNETKKDGLLEDIDKIKSAALQEQDKKKEITTKNKILVENGKEVERQITKDIAEINSSKKELDNLIEIAKKQAEKNIQAEKDLVSKDKLLKHDKKLLQQKIDDFSKEQDRYNEEIEIAKSSLEKETSELKENKLSLEDMLHEAKGQVNKYLHLEEELKREKIKLEEAKKDYNIKKAEYESVTRAMNKVLAEAEEAKKEALQAQNKATALEVSFRAQLRELDTQKTEFEIDELKFKKLVRDKKLTEELKRLKSQ